MQRPSRRCGTEGPTWRFSVFRCSQSDLGRSTWALSQPLWCESRCPQTTCASSPFSAAPERTPGWTFCSPRRPWPVHGVAWRQDHSPTASWDLSSGGQQSSRARARADGTTIYCFITSMLGKSSTGSRPAGGSDIKCSSHQPPCSTHPCHRAFDTNRSSSRRLMSWPLPTQSRRSRFHRSKCEES